MDVGMIGLGKMGLNMTRRLVRGGFRVVAFDSLRSRARKSAGVGGKPAISLEKLVDLLEPPRLLWMMLPAGSAVDVTVGRLRALLRKGDIVVDGGNSHYRDAIRHRHYLQRTGVHFMDVGVSGGIRGGEAGYCLMIGGETAVYKKMLPLLRALAPDGGYLYCGPSGAGHFVKMVHNGVEYGMMSSLGEGFAVLGQSPYAAGLDLAQVARLWNRGSIIRSWLLELVGNVFGKDRDLIGVKGVVEDSGEGRWFVQQAIQTDVPATLIASALFQRFRSRQADPFADRLLAALRHEFGGHAMRKAGRKAGRQK